MVSILTKLFLRKQLNFNEIIFEECRSVENLKEKMYNKFNDRFQYS
jgi:hypothetical protein